MAKVEIEVGGSYRYKGRIFTVVQKKPFGILVIREQGAQGPAQAKQSVFSKEAVKLSK